MGINILKNNPNIIIVAFVFTIISCNYSEHKENRSKAIDSLNYLKVISDNYEEICNTDSIRILFNKESFMINLLFSNSKLNIGQFNSSMGYAPLVQVDTIGQQAIISVVEVESTYGKDKYWITLFLFDKTVKSIKKICHFDEIHGGNEKELISDARYYDISLVRAERKIVFSEYFPYRSAVKKNIFNVKKEVCQF